MVLEFRRVLFRSRARPGAEYRLSSRLWRALSWSEEAKMSERASHRSLLIGCGLFLAAATPAAAAPVTPGGNNPAVVDLQLVLAVDVSRSMDFNEQRIQRDGYVAAFKSPEVQKAISSGPYG